MQLQQSSRKRVKLKCALQGPSGSGKTKSALLIAYGLCGNWSKIAVIDSENRSAELYSDIGSFMTVPLEPPYTPERYIEALNVCVAGGMEVVIIDSASHEWDNLLDYHSSLLGNSFTNWNKVTPRHEAFVSAILQANAHVICTIRSKQEYVLSEKNGKQVPEKVGMKGVQRENLEYEFTLVFELDMSLKAKVSKDRTSLFIGKPEFVPTIETGKVIMEWCNQGIEAVQVPIVTLEVLTDKVRKSTSTDELTALYNANPAYQQVLKNEFTARKQQLQQANNIIHQTN